MKKVIGNLNGHPIVVGDENVVTKNEYFYRSEDNKILLYKRGNDNKLQCVTIAEVAATSLSEDTINEINDILSE